MEDRETVKLLVVNRSYRYFLLDVVSTRRRINIFAGGSVERRAVGSFVQTQTNPRVHHLPTHVRI